MEVFNGFLLFRFLFWTLSSIIGAKLMSNSKRKRNFRKYFNKLFGSVHLIENHLKIGIEKHAMRNFAIKGKSQ